MKKDYEENYIPGSISFADGFLGPIGDVGYTMHLDRKKANRIVKKLLKEGLKIVDATIGLDGDWTENNETIFSEGKFIKEEYGMYESSIWATPILIINFEDFPSRTYEVWTKKD